MAVRVGYILEPPYPTFFVAEVDAVRKAGAEVTVFNSFRPFEQTYEAAERLRQESHYFPAGHRGVVADNLRRAVSRPAAYARVVRFLLQHGLGLRLALLAACYARAVDEEGIQHLHGGYGTTPATLAMLVSWLTDRPYSFTLHAAYDMFLSNPLLPQKARGARFFTTVSRYNRDYLERTYPSLDMNRLEVVRLGVDLEQWDCRLAEPENSVPTCVCVANLGPTKGHAVLLRAIRILRDGGTPFRCVIVGDGKLRSSLESLVLDLDISELVTFKGQIDPASVRACLERADVFALPVVVAEDGNHDGLPVALMESMAIGVPTVSSRVAGISELVRHEATGLLTSPGDEVDLAVCLRRLVEDSSTRTRLTRAARALVETEFDLAKNAASMVQLFARSASQN